MNILPFDKQVMAISALTEGCSIRAVERLRSMDRREYQAEYYRARKAARGA